MEPLTVIAAATGIAKALGLDQKVGRWIAGEQGAEVAAQVLDAARVVTGQTSPQAIAEALSADAEQAHQVRLRLLEIDEAESRREAEDRANARALQVAALAQDDTFAKRFVYWFAASWSLFAMAYLTMITVIEVPTGNQRYADTIIGFLLGTIIATIIGYFFGSSRSSQGKDSTLGALVEAVRARARG